ncbi:rho GTPase-activating protein 6 [Lutzomyia longipalpis]|uniref:rho GTPase-activating protein 6 n=1 Tax=Lutzomyia longipalpis TaxID=7200 RepID=UPI0024834472|nr:rho GTPase-activating protein 6 [Lutzomyia longipalpis]
MGRREGRRVRERWLLTRKTWRYMAEAGRRLLPEAPDATTGDIEQHFQDVCRAEPRFILWTRKLSYPGAVGATRRFAERLERHLSFDGLCSGRHHSTHRNPCKATQTDPEPPRSPTKEPEAPTTKPTRRTDDVSQSVGDTIKRYLRMARKKPAKESKQQFTSVNYDRVVIVSMAVDTEKEKGCQVEPEILMHLPLIEPRQMADTQTAPMVHKSKSSSNVGPLLSRKIWRGRSKSQTRPSTEVPPAKAQWSPQGKGVWASHEGQRIVLQDMDLQELTAVERKILQRIAAMKLQELNFGASAVPVEDKAPVEEKPKRRALLLKRKALTTGFFDANKKDDSRSAGATFGLGLEQCLANEVRATARRSGRASVGALPLDTVTHVRAGSCESLPSKAADAPPMGESLSQGDVRNEGTPPPRVPAIVRACIDHILAHGLSTVGIFRVSPARRRVRHLREEWERAGPTGITFEASHCPHDIATLLKEFLRDLPEPLLCRALYATFLATQRIRNRRLQLEALAHLIQLLPAAHRDTLRALLAFLADVARAANDGNRMDSTNLATVFAPNILRADDDRVEERLDAINVIRTMIDHQEELFLVPAALMDEVYAEMMEAHGPALDRLCERRAAEAPEVAPPRLTRRDEEERRRMSSPLVLHGHGVLSASLRIPVTVAPLHVGDNLEDIPYIEDTSASEHSDHAKTSQRSLATVTGTLSLAASPAAQTERVFFPEEPIQRRPHRVSTSSSSMGAVMRSKTEDFERRKAPGGETRRQPIYKRREIISSAQSSRK